MTSSPTDDQSVSSEDTSAGVLSLVDPLPAPSTPRSLRARLSYLLLFRSVIISVLLLTTIVLRLGAGQPLFAAASIVLYGVCIGSYATILVGALWLRRFDAWGVVPLAYVQLLSDSIVASVLVITTGGSESAFVFLFSLAILNAAAVMGRKPAIIFAVANSLLYIAIVVVQLSDQARAFDLSRMTLVAVMPSMVANTLAFFLVAILSGSLTEQLRRASEGLDVAKAQLAEVGALHEAVLRSLPSGVLTTDASGRIVYVNEAAREIIHAHTDDVLGHSVEDFLPGIPENISAQSRFEILLPRQDQIHVVGGSVARMTHAVAGTVVVFQELTELRRLQAAVARADRLQTVGRFAAGLAHEVRNPLAAIVGCLQLLTKAGDLHEDDARRMIDIAHREAQRLSKLVSDFLLYARPAPPDLGAVRLDSVVDEAVAGARAAISTSEDTVTIDVAADDDVTVLADNAQVRQVLWNLINNAVAATTGGVGPIDASRQSRVLLTVARRQGMGAVIIDDTGPGVPIENRARVFVPFFTTRASGTGLGLPTAHALVLGQGGEIDIEESPLGGARFILTLPLFDPGAK